MNMNASSQKINSALTILKGPPLSKTIHINKTELSVYIISSMVQNGNFFFLRPLKLGVYAYIRYLLKNC